jgi:hypothetical protein
MNAGNRPILMRRKETLIFPFPEKGGYYKATAYLYYVSRGGPWKLTIDSSYWVGDMEAAAKKGPQELQRRLAAYPEPER